MAARGQDGPGNPLHPLDLGVFVDEIEPALDPRDTPVEVVEPQIDARQVDVKPGEPVLEHWLTIGSALYEAHREKAGCTVNVTWSKPGATTQDFNADSYACQKDMYQTTGFGSGLGGVVARENFGEQCMIAHGWTKQ